MIDLRRIASLVLWCMETLPRSLFEEARVTVEPECPVQSVSWTVMVTHSPAYGWRAEILEVPGVFAMGATGWGAFCAAVAVAVG